MISIHYCEIFLFSWDSMIGCQNVSIIPSFFSSKLESSLITSTDSPKMCIFAASDEETVQIRKMAISVTRDKSEEIYCAELEKVIFLKGPEFWGQKFNFWPKIHAVLSNFSRIFLNFLPKYRQCQFFIVFQLSLQIFRISYHLGTKFPGSRFFRL